MECMEKTLCAEEGSGRGDPLSPILYVLGGDLFQSILNRALAEGRLHLPIPISGNYPIIQYADDTLVVLPAEKEQLMVFKESLELFASITGLKINYHKYSLIPINLEPGEESDMAEVLNCQIASMPFTYLDCPWELQNL